jgi:DnaJ-class molecular chaperone
MITILAIGGILIAFAGLTGQDRSYVGAVKCKKCHKAPKRGNQYQAWLDSRHNKSYAVLSSLSALEEAKKANLTTPPNESPQCLKCHSPLYEKAPELIDQGVTCEVCHGPGSDYQKMSIMKDREKAALNGLAVYGSREAIKEKCITCHTGEHFSFNAAWEKIEHPVPPKQ